MDIKSNIAPTLIEGLRYRVMISRFVEVLPSKSASLLAIGRVK